MTPQLPIFIVGAPRSGTTLLASMLTGHSRIACGPETQFFSKLSEKRLTRAVRDPNWPEQALGLVTSLTLAEQRVFTLFGHKVEELEACLASREPSVGAILESLTQLYASKRGKPRWAEKTPNHLLHLPALRKCYPDAPIMRIVRDPRDSALSMRKLPWASPSVIANGYLWASWFEASQPFFERDPMTLTVRYEDLVENPLATLTTICSFVGEGFESGMLENHKHGHSVASPNETWKATNTAPLDSSRTGLWQRELDAKTQRALGSICQDGIAAFGYPRVPTPNRTLAGFPLTLSSAEAHEDALLRASSSGRPIAATRRPHHEHELLLLPNLAGTRLQQFKTAVRLASVLFSRHLRGRRTHYLLPEAPRAGWTQRSLFELTRWLGTPYTISRTSEWLTPARAPALTRQNSLSVATRPARAAQRPRPSQQRGPHPHK